LLTSGVYTSSIVGDDSVYTSSSLIHLTVTKPGFTLTAVQPNPSVSAGKPVTAVFALDVTPFEGWTTPVTLAFDPSSVQGLSIVGLTRYPAPQTVASTLVVAPNERVYLVAVTTANTPPGVRLLSIDAQGGGRQQTLDVVLSINSVVSTKKVMYLPIVRR
jgi:hypothetical protein